MTAPDTAITRTNEASTAPPEMAPAPGAPQFMRGFDGIATEPFAESARKVLAAAVDPRDVEIKPDGIVFLPGVAYRRILTRAFGAGGWAIAPRSPARIMGNIVVYHGALYCLGRFVAEAVGECFYREANANMSYASCVEGARTDALTRCCKDLGIATELWDANWRAKWQAEYAYQDSNDRTRDGKPKWKLKHRVNNPHDLMAGAGGVAPEPVRTAAASDESQSAAKVCTAGSSVAPAAAPESAPFSAGSASATPDAGEAATDEQIAAVRARIKELAWKLGFVRQWFAAHFAIVADKPDRLLGALTRDQADNAYLLLNVFGQPLYDRLLADLRAKGLVK